MVFILCDSFLLKCTIYALFHPQQPTSFYKGLGAGEVLLSLDCVVSQVGGVRKSRVVGSCCDYCPVVWLLVSRWFRTGQWLSCYLEDRWGHVKKAVGRKDLRFSHTPVGHWLGGHALAGPKASPCRLDISLPVIVLGTLCLRAC